MQVTSLWSSRVWVCPWPYLPKVGQHLAVPIVNQMASLKVLVNPQQQPISIGIFHPSLWMSSDALVCHTFMPINLKSRGNTTPFSSAFTMKDVSSTYCLTICWELLCGRVMPLRLPTTIACFVVACSDYVVIWTEREHEGNHGELLYEVWKAMLFGCWY